MDHPEYGIPLFPGLPNSIPETVCSVLANANSVAALKLRADLPKALRALRGRVQPRLTQGALKARGGPPLSTVAKLESGVHLPDLETLFSYLNAVGATLYDLAVELEGGGGSPGQVQPQIVADVLGRGRITDDLLFGFARGYAGDPKLERDFVASVAEAARVMAQQVMNERSTMVAERGADYGDGEPPGGRRR